LDPKLNRVVLFGQRGCGRSTADQVLGQSRLQWIVNAGHNAFEPEMTRAMVQTIATATQAHS